MKVIYLFLGKTTFMCLQRFLNLVCVSARVCKYKKSGKHKVSCNSRSGFRFLKLSKILSSNFIVSGSL